MCCVTFTGPDDAVELVVVKVVDPAVVDACTACCGFNFTSNIRRAQNNKIVLLMCCGVRFLKFKIWNLRNHTVALTYGIGRSLD